MPCIRRFIGAFVCLLLAVSTLAACGGAAELRPYKAALGDSTPTGAVLKTSLDSDLGELCAEYTAAFSDGAISVEYKRDTVTEFDPDIADSGKITETEGSYAKAADGTVTGEISPLVLSVLTRGITLDEGYISAYAVGEEGTLSFSVSAENTETVFGTPIGYGVNCKITLAEKRITVIELSYTAASGEALVKCEYGY